MMVNSRYLVCDAPTTCAHCKKPFPVVNGSRRGMAHIGGRVFLQRVLRRKDEEEARFSRSQEGVVFVDYTFVFNCTGARP